MNVTKKLAKIVAKDPDILPTLIIAPFLFGVMLALFLPLALIMRAMAQ